MAENTSETNGTGKKSGQAWVWIILFLVVVAVGGGLIYMTKSKQPTEDKAVTGQTESGQQATASGQLDQGKKAEDQAEDKTSLAKVMDLTADKKKSRPDQTADKTAETGTSAQVTEKDTPVEAKSATRKAKLGLKKSVQGVVAENESIKVGDKIIPMERIASKIRSEKRQVKEENLGGESQAAAKAGANKSGVDMEVKPTLKFGGKKLTEKDLTTEKQDSAKTVKITTGQADKSQEDQSEKDKAAVKAALMAVQQAQTKEQPQAKDQTAAKPEVKQALDQENKATAKAEKPLPRLYGVRVAQPGDNLWDIHFMVLKEYFSHRGITVSKHADSPDSSGHSSGVGRILKYAERMAYIYSVREDKLLDNLNYIRPEDLIIVFDMTRLSNILKKLDAQKIKHVRFDGTHLYLEN